MTPTPVLMYHSVGRPLDQRFRRWVVSPSLLAEHLAALTESGHELAGVTEWAGHEEQRKCAVLTFDDGYADFAENALPVLGAYQARATVYVVTAYVGSRAHWLFSDDERNPPLMSWEDLRLVKESGIEIGSHSHRHLELDAVSCRIAKGDVLRSIAVLSHNGFAPQSFSYPFGYASRRTRDIVARAGFSTACIVGRGLAQPGRDPLRVRRLVIDHRTSPEALLRRINGAALPPASMLRAAAQPAWRVARRARTIARVSTKVGITE
jgi:peptidoglycan/xylan/chitin deacetylase (PgdA/CDA1 family)